MTAAWAIEERLVRRAGYQEPLELLMGVRYAAPLRQALSQLSVVASEPLARLGLGPRLRKLRRFTAVELGRGIASGSAALAEKEEGKGKE
jgi:hypothetical protein